MSPRVCWGTILQVARPANYDVDGDGMADVWELHFGLDPADVTDGTLDLDGNGYTNLEEFLNGTRPALAADFDFDGNVDGDDFLVWQSQFGSGSASSSATPAIPPSAVPEPSAVVLFGLVLAVILLRVGMLRRTRAPAGV